MIALQSKGLPSRIAETIVGRIIPDRESKSSFYVSKESIDGFDPLNSRIDCLLTTSDNAGSIGDHSSITKLPGLGHLSAGDIVSIDPSGLVRTVFRLESHHNAFFVTDRCNSKCLMCSQPPRNIDDIDYHHNINIQMLDLIPRSTEQIGITGGEPTLLGPKLLELLRKSSTNLPDTGIHMLSHGETSQGNLLGLMIVWLWEFLCMRITLQTMIISFRRVTHSLKPSWDCITLRDMVFK